jgi:hypothetical protein
VIRVQRVSGSFRFIVDMMLRLGRQPAASHTFVRRYLSTPTPQPRSGLSSLWGAAGLVALGAAGGAFVAQPHVSGPAIAKIDRLFGTSLRRDPPAPIISQERHTEHAHDTQQLSETDVSTEGRVDSTPVEPMHASAESTPEAPLAAEPPREPDATSAATPTPDQQGDVVDPQGTGSAGTDGAPTVSAHSETSTQTDPQEAEAMPESADPVAHVLFEDDQLKSLKTLSAADLRDHLQSLIAAIESDDKLEVVPRVRAFSLRVS